MTRYNSDVAFSDAVKAEQEVRGSRRRYAEFERSDGMLDVITPELEKFIAARFSLYLATASAAGQPYVQHRGGKPGFLKVLDDKTLAFADVEGNRQYITLGNLAENDKALIFLMDYANRRRIKLWGRARVVEDDADLFARINPDSRINRAIVFTLDAWDMNCPAHIPRLFAESEVAATIEALQSRIAELESELARLRQAES